MTKNYIVKELINQMKERIPPGHNLANYLTDTLYMGKEAVYRRSDYWKPLIQPGHF